ncbi:MAG: hypothetical protein ABIQ74_09685 [Chitinophagales bacterium]
MKIVFILLIINSFFTLHSNAQTESLENERKDLSRKFFFYWGYNRAIFTRSDIHFRGAGYNFTVFGVTAHDRPSSFTFKEYFGLTSWSVPQYNYRLGYYFNEHLSVSLGQDHMKYVIDRDQIAKVSGVVSPEASEQYAGEYFDAPTSITPDFLTYEHTDGLNLFSLDVEYTLKVVSFFQNKLLIDLNTGAGGIWMVPRTDVRVFGYGLNNIYHLAGYSITAKAGPQIELFQHYFLRAQTRVGYITMPNVLIHNEAPDRADQNFSFMEWYVAAGILIPFKKSSK